jgi:hypothetical protein
VEAEEEAEREAVRVWVWWERGVLLSQEILAVTPMPWVRASAMPSRIWTGPPMRERRGDWRRPGMRREGERNVMRREGAGRTRRY